MKGSESDLILPGVALSRWSYVTHLNRYFFAGTLARGRVLDIGCGVGYGSKFLLTRGAKPVIGADISEEVLKIGHNTYGANGPQFIKTNAELLPFPDACFDVVIAIGILDHLDNPTRLLSETRRILRPGGLIICSVLNRKFISPPLIRNIDPFHLREYTPEELLEVIIACEYEKTSIYGFVYGSRWWWQSRAVLNFIAKRLGLTGDDLSRLGRVLSPKQYRQITYSEDSILPEVKSDWFPIKPEDESKVSSFIIVGEKGSSIQTTT
jgi:ubiquinone/menaquinone biosynthesis C-methylase UbiE